MSYAIKRRAYYRRLVDLNDTLFLACWVSFMRGKRSGKYHPSCDEDVVHLLVQIAEAKCELATSTFRAYVC